MQVQILIGTDGKARYIRHEEAASVLSGLGSETTRRASHVYPVDRPRRWLFRSIRRLVSDNSPVAAWTRRWGCQWLVDLSLSNGPVLGPYVTRAAAIEAEERYLRQSGVA